MGGSVEYRVFLDGNAVDRDFYNMIETVTVEQSMDLATEARVEVEMCADPRGSWSGPTDKRAQPWQRMRIEVKNMTPTWVPLIEGPIVGWDAQMSGEPGQSTNTLIVRDDSVYLNIETALRTFEGKSDDDVVKELLTRDQRFISDEPEIDPFPARPNGRALKIQRTCTQIELLLQLAQPLARHVFVRPGKTPGGKSIAYVKRFVPTGQRTLPALVLNGPQRNIESFTARSDAARGARRTGANLDPENVKVQNPYTSNPFDVRRIGDRDPFSDAQQPTRMELVDPQATFYDVQEVVNAQQEKDSFVLVGRGSLRAGCYAGVLTAYDLVATSGVNELLCTTWMIRDVTHTLGRSEYRQEFTLISNAGATISRSSNKGIPAEVKR